MRATDHNRFETADRQAKEEEEKAQRLAAASKQVWTAIFQHQITKSHNYSRQPAAHPRTGPLFIGSLARLSFSHVLSAFGP